MKLIEDQVLGGIYQNVDRLVAQDAYAVIWSAAMDIIWEAVGERIQHQIYDIAYSQVRNDASEWRNSFEVST